jgi:CBS domain-containing protein
MAASSCGPASGGWRNPRAGTIGAGWAGRGIAVLTAAFAVLLSMNASTDVSLSVLWGLAVAAMLWMSSTAVLRQQALRDRLPTVSALALSRPSISVTPDVPLAEAVRRTQEAHAQSIVIVDGEGRPTGVVREAAVNAVPIARRPWVDVGSVSHQVSESELINAKLAGEELLNRLQVSPASEYIVVDQTGAIFGVLAAADVAAALTGRRPTGTRAPRRAAR